jgi:hypothetical protein
MPRLSILLAAMVLFSTPQAFATCGTTENRASVLHRNSTADAIPISLETGRQVTAFRDVDDPACSITFELGERTSIAFEMSSPARASFPERLRDMYRHSPDAAYFLVIPFDLIRVGDPVSHGDSSKYAGDISDEGMITDITLNPGHYVLTFPSRKETISARFYGQIVNDQPSVVRLTIANIERIGISNYPLPLFDHPLTPKSGEHFDIEYQAYGEMEAAPLQVSVDTFIVLSISSTKLFSDPALSQLFRINIDQSDRKNSRDDWIFPQSISHSQNKEEIRFGFSLPVGTSNLTSRIVRDFYRMIPRELWQTKFTVTFEEVIPHPPSFPVARVDKMLTISGYSEYVDVIEIASIQEVRSDPLHHEIRLADFLDFKGGFSSRSTPFRPPGTEAHLTSELALSVPRYLILMDLHQDGYEFLDTQQNIIRKNGQSVFDLILTQASLGLGVSRKDIGIVIPARCTVGLVRGDTLIDTYLQNNGCTGSAASSRELQLDHNAGFGAAKAKLVLKTMNDFPVTVERFLNSKFDSKSIQYLSREPDYVEVIVRGLKGYVIKGSPYWEKVTMFFIKQGNEESGHFRIRLIADGDLAAGAGSYPPDSQFNTNIEENNSKSLTNFVDSVLDDFVRATSNGG